MLEETTLEINSIITPELNESPTRYADRLGIAYKNTVTEEHKKNAGQFFTPVEISKYMTSLISSNKECIKILDPGCGIGILTVAAAETLIERNKNIKNIEIVGFENDINILPYSESCFEYLRTWLSERNVNFTFFLCKNDFILHNARIISSDENNIESYDLVIANPPYFKIRKDDKRVLISKPLVNGQTNIYSIFILLSLRLLKKKGQIIFISPRSFCSGEYFKFFREKLLSTVEFKTIHLFKSRKAVFSRDKVLQENIILSANKRYHINENQLQLYPEPDNFIAISNSVGISDINSSQVNKYEEALIIRNLKGKKIIHLPLTEIDEKIIRIFSLWQDTLASCNLCISTGPVVGFRNERFISFNEDLNTVPLLWLHNVGYMNCMWPSENNFKQKGEYIISNQETKPILVINSNFVLLRRFSTKDDKRRLIAAPYIASHYKSSFVGIENHLNYIYSKDGYLSRDETYGLAAILNSRLFDLYFRTFNGNINVSSSELRDLPMPDFELIKTLGSKVNNRLMDGKEIDIDGLIKSIFKLDIEL